MNFLIIYWLTIIGEALNLSEYPKQLLRRLANEFEIMFSTANAHGTSKIAVELIDLFFSCKTTNSAVADKPRDTFCDYCSKCTIRCCSSSESCIPSPAVRRPYVTPFHY